MVESTVLDGEDVWAQTIIDAYWIPGFGKKSGLDEHFQNIADVFSKSQDLTLYQAFKVFSDSVRSVQSFLALPYTLAKSIRDMVRVPGNVDEPPWVALLADTFRNPSVADQLQLMKQQAVMLLWGAYETFSRDVFIYELNKDPSLYAVLTKSSLKDKFLNTQLFTFGELEKHDFNLQGQLGTALAEGKDFSSPALLRTLFPILYVRSEDKKRLAAATESPVLWILGNRRHLVAHRGGVVDQAYIDRTGDIKQKPGQRLNIEGHEIDQAIHCLALAAISIMSESIGDDIKWARSFSTARASPAPQSEL